jgi:mRNA-degrading endonuclease YafQ of YafQ-DinJ toxin-antitoxin module
MAYIQLAMWEIYEDKNLAKLLSKGMPIEVVKRYEKWKDVIRFSGPIGLRAIKGFRDKALSGNWKGYRSSRLGIQWRVIHRVEATAVSVFVERVSPHDSRD